MIKTSFQNPQKLPLVIEPTRSACAELLFETIHRRSLLLKEKLLQHGALLFRGFEIGDLSTLEQFARHFAGRELFNYAGGASPRQALGEGVYTSTEYPPDIALALHNELSYADVFPETLYFFCLVAPASGGETTLGDSRRILQSLDSDVVDTFRRRKVCYIRHLQAGKGSGYSWQDAFEADDRAKVEMRCREIGASFEWQTDDCLRLSQIRPATYFHPLTGEEVWFNQADGFHPSSLGLENYQTLPASELRLNACFGDGSAIEEPMLAHIRTVMERETIPLRWQKGDILVLDNILTAHGRRPFAGARKIALAMT